jgi:PII-like signaling protein
MRFRPNSYAETACTATLGERPVDEDCLKLTTYMAERRRTSEGFVSDALLGLYAQHQVASGVVLRGIAGFGTGRNLRSDVSLSLSEDPPVAIVAVDTRDKIEALIDPVLAVKQRGLVTLERARLLRDTIVASELPVELREAVKLTIYVGRKERADGVPAYIAICDLLHRRQIAGATVLLGVDGVAHGERQRAHFFGRNADVPMMIIAVGSGERIGQVLPELGALLRQPMFTIERVRVCKRDGELLERPHPLPGVDEHGLPLWQKLMVYTSESARHDGVPIHRAIVQQLRRLKTPDGATVLRGLWGFHGDHQPHGDRLLSLTRRVPVVTIVVDTPTNIAESFDVVDELTRDEGLVTCEMVPALVSDEGDAGPPRMARHRY